VIWCRQLSVLMQGASYSLWINSSLGVISSWYCYGNKMTYMMISLHANLMRDVTDPPWII
jgi:hypothetical protein